MRSELVGDLLQVEASEVLRVLRKARELVRGGYATDWCFTDGPADARLSLLSEHERAYSLDDRGQLRVHALGVICQPFDEGVRFYDLRGAIEVAAAGNVDAQILVEDLLWWLMSPEFGDRAQLAGRFDLKTLIRFFDRAVLRAQSVSRQKD